MSRAAMRRVVAGAALLAGAAALAPVAAQAEEPAWVVGAGLFGVEGNEPQRATVDLQYRGAPLAWGITPVLGGALNDQGGAWAYAGLGRAFPWRRWSAHVSLAAAGYRRGDGADLGSGLQFRSALDLSYRVAEQVRLGLAVAHLSNAGLGDFNPGVETLSLTAAWSPGRR